MKRILSLLFAGILVSIVGMGCGEREVQSQEEMRNLQREQQPMSQDQTTSERPLDEVPQQNTGQ